MNNFYYYNPTKIIFGRNSIPNIVKEIPGNAHVLMIYGGGSIKRSLVYEQVISALKGYELYEFSGVESNPEYETGLKILEKIREKNINYLLAVGGGSVIDATKFVSLAYYSTQDPWDFLIGKCKSPDRALPFGCIQTLPGTGSEMNNGFIISRRNTNDKIIGTSFHTYPKFSILDPESTYSAPLKQIAYGIIDMFVHVIEQYITYPSGAILQDRQAEALLLTIKEVGPKLLEHPDDYNLRANIMWCSAQALNGTLSRGVPCDWTTHNIGHALTAMYGLVHAETVAIVLGGLWHSQLGRKKEKLIQYGKRIWNLKGDADAIAEKAIIKTELFFETLGVSTRLSDYGLNSMEVAEKISLKFANNKAKLGEHHDIDHEQIKNILRFCQ